MTADDIYIAFGRCRSGKRWFWYASARSYGHNEPHCDDPACSPGLTGHDYGWEDTEQAALDAMHAAASRLAGKPWGRGIGRPTWAAEMLKQINAAKRRTRPPKQGAAEAAPVEYLYEPWSWYDDYCETHKGINEIPIVKKTARRIYYDNSDSWDRTAGTVTLGYLSREEFETDTRCHDSCPRAVPAGLVCAPHGRNFRHCIHWGADWSDKRPRCLGVPPGCGDDCPVNTQGFQCARHGYMWEHCPHGRSQGDCYHGTAAGEARLPGRSSYHREGTVYATRQAAEEYLYRREREQERKRKGAEPELRRLRMAMADAHPDRGGTNEEFIAARERYERAQRQAS